MYINVNITARYAFKHSLYKKALRLIDHSLNIHRFRFKAIVEY